MRFYGSSYTDTLELPLTTFWMMSNNISRLSAEEDIRKLAIAAGSSSDKGFSATNEALKKEMGEVFVKSFDEEVQTGLKTLKSIAGKQKRREA